MPKLKIAPGDYVEAFEAADRLIQSANKTVVIGIDGRSGAGKTSFAGWLAWQTGRPVLHLDLFIDREAKAFTWRRDDVLRVVEGRARKHWPIIIDSVMLLDALDFLDLKPDHLIYIEEARQAEDRERHADLNLFLAPHDQRVEEYLQRQRPMDKAQSTIRWQNPVRV